MKPCVGQGGLAGSRDFDYLPVISKVGRKEGRKGSGGKEGRQQQGMRRMGAGLSSQYRL